MRTPYVAALAVATVIALSSCATAPRAPSVREVACADPLYVRLKAVHPDSLREREYSRLRDLETACQVSGMMGGSHWYWMPALVVVSAAMGVMMGR